MSEFPKYNAGDVVQISMDYDGLSHCPAGIVERVLDHTASWMYLVKVDGEPVSRLIPEIGIHHYTRAEPKPEPKYTVMDFDPSEVTPDHKPIMDSWGQIRQPDESRHSQELLNDHRPCPSRQFYKTGTEVYLSGVAGVPDKTLGVVLFSQKGVYAVQTWGRDPVSAWPYQMVGRAVYDKAVERVKSKVRSRKRKKA